MRVRLLPKLLILAGVVLTVGLYYSRENLRLDWEDLVELVNIQIDNFSYPFNAERSRPVSSLETETNLNSNVGEPFISFSKSQWDKFWDILYGAYPVDYSDNERLPPRVRQLNYPEMEEKLAQAFPQPFAYFQEEHWKQFWPMVFGKKAKPR